MNDDDDKNNYDLINSLLEDGSESSILKLQMVIDWKYFNFTKLKKQNHVLFLKLFEDYTYQKFEKYTYYYTQRASDEVVWYMIDKGLKICFPKNLNKNNSLIKYVESDEVYNKLKQISPGVDLFDEQL